MLDDIIRTATNGITNKENTTMTEQEKVSVTPVAAEVPVEKISDEDKAILDKSMAEKEKALLTAKLAISQSETLEMNHNNIVLRLALKYKLSDGDTISNENGVISRKK